MAEGVVHDFEIVEVDVEQRAGAPVSRFGHRIPHGQREPPAVEEFRQRVVVGEKFQVGVRDLFKRLLAEDL